MFKIKGPMGVMVAAVAALTLVGFGAGPAFADTAPDPGASTTVTTGTSAPASADAVAPVVADPVPAPVATDTTNVASPSEQPASTDTPAPAPVSASAPAADTSAPAPADAVVSALAPAAAPADMTAPAPATADQTATPDPFPVRQYSPECGTTTGGGVLGVDVINASGALADYTAVRDGDASTAVTHQITTNSLGVSFVFTDVPTGQHVIVITNDTTMASVTLNGESQSVRQCYDVVMAAPAITQDPITGVITIPAAPVAPACTYTSVNQTSGSAIDPTGTTIAATPGGTITIVSTSTDPTACVFPDGTSSVTQSFRWTPPFNVLSPVKVGENQYAVPNDSYCGNYKLVTTVDGVEVVGEVVTGQTLTLTEDADVKFVSNGTCGTLTGVSEWTLPYESPVVSQPVTPTAPAFNATTGVTTIPSADGRQGVYHYVNTPEGTVVDFGGNIQAKPGETITVEAVLDAGVSQSFAEGAKTKWTNTFTPADNGGGAVTTPPTGGTTVPVIPVVGTPVSQDAETATTAKLSESDSDTSGLADTGSDAESGIVLGLLGLLVGASAVAFGRRHARHAAKKQS